MLGWKAGFPAVASEEGWLPVLCPPSLAAGCGMASQDTGSFLLALCSQQSPGCHAALAVVPGPCWDPGGCSLTWAVQAEQGFCLYESLSVGRSQPGPGWAWLAQRSLVSLNTKSAAVHPRQGSWRVVLPSLEVQLPGPFLSPCTPPNTPTNSVSAKRRVAWRGSASLNPCQSAPHPTGP